MVVRVMRTSSPRIAAAALLGSLGLVGATSCSSILGLDEFTVGTGTTGGSGGNGHGGSSSGDSSSTSSGGGTASSSTGGTFCTPGTTEACYSGPAGTSGVGSCKDGTHTCKSDGSAWDVVCTGEVTPAAEDCALSGDENCNGTVDEGCACTPGSVAACYDGPATTKGVGDCVPGTHTCNADGLGYGTCNGETTPLVEICDAAMHDEDCDGQINEDGAGCVCAPGSVAPCYTGPAGTKDVGLCVGGTWTCGLDGLGYGACGGQVTPQAETCAAAADEDCSGADCVAWAKIHGDATDGGALGLTVDASGNVYAGGFFTGSMVVGSLPPLLSSGGNDAFLVKYNAAGTPLWSQKFGLSGDQSTTDVAVDAAGNVVVAGYFTGTITFGASTYPTLVNEYRTFLVKLDPSGAVLWSTSFTTVSGVQIAVDPISLNQGGGNIAVIGTSVVGGDNNVNVRKFGPDGTPLWSKTYGDAAVQTGEDVAMDSAGNIFVTGEFKGTMSFGGANLTSLGPLNVFLAKLDSTGAEAWSQRFGDATGDKYGGSIAVALTGEVAVAGPFFGTIDLGGPNGIGKKTSAGNADIFVALFSSGGAPIWSKSFGDAQLQVAHRIAIDANKNVFATGWMFGTMNFGGGLLTSAGAEDVYVVKLDSTGNHVWSKNYGDSATQLGQAIALSPSGQAVVAGWTKGTINFGLGPLVSAGSYDAFVAKLAQ